MADLNAHVAYLSQEIGPRPAGTEEEQRAALYISEQLSSQEGLVCTMEDFQCNPDSSLPRALCSGVAVAATLLGTIVPMLAIPAIVIALICCVLYAAEVFEKPVLSRMLNRGVSQNVVAKYVPLKSATRASRRRKVIIVANYDTGKERRGLNDGVIALLPAIYWAELIAFVLMPCGLALRSILSLEETPALVFNIVLGVFMIIAVLPLVSFIMEKLANYNEGANCNGAGVAVLMDVAARVAAARNLPDEPEPTIHGEQAALSAGLIPEGAEVSYDLGNTADDLGASMESAAARLAAAKAAVAALTGKPVSSPSSEDSASSSGEPASDDASAGSDAAGTADSEVVEETLTEVAAEPVAVPSAVWMAPQEPQVPDWFTKAQAQAKKPKKEKPVQRSRYAVALEKAEEEINAREQSERDAAAELSERMRGMRADVQAASVAAGVSATGVIADLEETQTVEETQTGEETPDVNDESSTVVAVESASEEPDENSVVPEAPEEASVVVEEESDTLEPLIPLVVPEIEPASDPEVIVREEQRPLTGSTVAAPPVDMASVLADLPTPGEEAQPAEEAPRRLVIPSVGEVPAVPVTPIPTAAAVETPVPTRRRRAISLPNIGISQELPRISMDDHQQAAPLAEERPVHDGRVRDLSALIPSVAADTSAAVAGLSGTIPSLNVTTSEPGASGSIHLAGAFTAMGATGAAAPLGDELIEAVDETDLYVDDADDSAYVEQTTETGAMAGPGYVEMPKRRFGGLFGRHRRKTSEEEATPQEWLDVEENFDAREVGAARGSWESFREDEFGSASTPAGSGAGQSYEVAEEDSYGEGDFPPPRPIPGYGRSYEGGAFSRDLLEGTYEGAQEEDNPSIERESVFAEGLPSGFVFDTTSELDQIEQFRSERIDMEVWFVALGSELAGNGGMRAFVEAHETELKGSIFIELEGLGAGELSLIEKEGTYMPKKASSRMKRLTRKAGSAVGLKVGEATMEWRDSSSAYALRHGQQAMHLAGMAGRKPAFFAQEDDVVENTDGEQIALNSDFVMELLKSI